MRASETIPVREHNEEPKNKSKFFSDKLLLIKSVKSVVIFYKYQESVFFILKTNDDRFSS